jgi:hypothetical protein
MKQYNPKPGDFFRNSWYGKRYFFLCISEPKKNSESLETFRALVFCERPSMLKITTPYVTEFTVSIGGWEESFEQIN